MAARRVSTWRMRTDYVTELEEYSEKKRSEFIAIM